MKISTKGRYALRMMLDIAAQGEGAIVPLRDIEHRQGISVKYQEQIVSKLHKAGYLKSIRGVQGGYMLTMTPPEYRVGDVLRTVEGNLAPIACLTDEINQCDHCEECATLWFWEGMDNLISEYVDRFTLQDFLDHRAQMK